jgi:hypothetical protein
MKINVITVPQILTWHDFTPSSGRLIDPNDGSLIDALTAFNFNFPSLPPVVKNGVYSLSLPNNIIIGPSAQVWVGVSKTAKLLSHEQFHYDVGTATARALARQLAVLKANSVAKLGTMMREAFNLHFTKRAGLIQRRYDLDTRHGTNDYYQKIWKKRMDQCLADPKSTTIGGFYL